MDGFQPGREQMQDAYENIYNLHKKHVKHENLFVFDVESPAKPIRNLPF